MRFVEAFLAVVGVYTLAAAVVTRIAWRTKPAAAPVPEVPAEVPDSSLQTNTDVLATCGGCAEEIAVPSSQTVLMATGSWWNVEGVCPECAMPWRSRDLNDAEAAAMRAVGVVDGQAAVEVLRLALETDDALRSWLSP